MRFVLGILLVAIELFVLFILLMPVWVMATGF
jgi:hypothetical protein